MQSLQVWGGLELPPQGPLAQVVPLGEEPGPLVEALDLLPAELVHQGLEGRVGSQDRERGEPLVLRGSPGHVVGQSQEPPRVGHRKPATSVRPLGAYLSSAWQTRNSRTAWCYTVHRGGCTVGSR